MRNKIFFINRQQGRVKAEVPFINSKWLEFITQCREEASANGGIGAEILVPRATSDLTNKFVETIPIFIEGL